MNNSDWEEEQVDRSFGPGGEFIRIFYAGDSTNDKNRISISTAAYATLGRPEAVKIFIRKSKDMIRLEASTPGMVNARRIRVASKSVRLSGGPSLVKKYKMRRGYYTHKGDGVFEWSSL